MTVAAIKPSGDLIDRLPAVRGRYSVNAPLHTITWFRVGGPADVLYRPADGADLQQFLAGKPADVAVTLIGVGSNLLVRDGGVAGVVIRLGRGFADISVDGTQITAGAMALDYNVALTSQDAGIAGLEFLAGVPGTIGGGLRMNAGAYGHELKDVVRRVEALDASGKAHSLSVEEWAPRYRGCGVPDDWIFTGTVLQGSKGDPAEIGARIAEVQTTRGESQPIRSRTGGSTFKNPPGEKAWQLIDDAGCRGLQQGGAMVSEKHCNFLINTGDATAADIESLGEEVRRRVLDHSGITLNWEIRRIGRQLATGDGDRHG
ncbi:MAG: UDP-N-acetylmuramate dehydrogenase [Alphaproteobacteria bacterium]